MSSLEHIRERLQYGFFAFWVNNWRVSFLLIFLIIALGALSLFTLPKESSPKIDFGIIQVSTVRLGVSPVDIDTLVTEEIEESIKDITGIKKITSSSRVGIANTTIELENDVDIQKVLTEIKDEVEKADIPDEAEDPFVVELTTDSEIMFELIIYGDELYFSSARLKELARTIKDQLEGKGSISSIDIAGSADYELHVLLDRGKMEQIGLTIAQITSTIRAFNQNQPLGNYEVDNLNYDFRIDGELADEQALLSLPVVFNGPSLVVLADIARIAREYDDESVRKVGLYEDRGYNSVTLTFNKRPGDNIFTAASKAKEEITKLLQTQQFAGASYLYASDLSEIIQEDYRVLAKSGLQTLIFVFLCLLLFVGLKESAIATIAIPMAFLVTFIVLDQIGFSLNFLTNFSLVLTLGIAIDTTIVVIEAAYERMKLGYNPKTAILLAVRDFKAPLIAGTSTTIVVFIPMMVLPGVTGKFLAYIPITVFVTLIAALFISLTINSALFFKLSKKKKYYLSEEATEKFMTEEDRILLADERQGKSERAHDQKSRRQRILDNLGSRYESKLRTLLSSKRMRLLNIFVPFVALIFTFMFLSPQIGFTLFPDGDNEVFNLAISNEVGATTDSTNQITPFVENILSDIPELKHYTINVRDENMSIAVELTDKNFRKDNGQRSVFDVEADTLEKLAFLEQEGRKVESQVLAGGPPQGKPVAIKLIADTNDKFATLINIAKAFEQELRTYEGTKNVTISSKDTPGQFIYEYDVTKLRSLGLTPQDINSEISFALNGFGAGSIKIGSTDVDISVMYDQFDATVTPTDVTDLIVATSAGPIRVGEVMSYRIDNAVGEISREDTNITITVDADLEEGYVAQAGRIQNEFLSWAETYTFPDGISYQAGGENQENADLIAATVRGFFIAFFLIFVILVLQFNSFRKPSIILYSVFLAMLGVNVGLYLTGNPYSMPFAIGFIALTGIVVNDAIIMIDRVRQNISHQIDTFEAIVEAARSRLQPIILTTMTTLLGVLPISLQDEFWEGLGFTMIFGLFAGSAMTLFVIPSLYYTLFAKKNGKKKKELEVGKDE